MMLERDYAVLSTNVAEALSKPDEARCDGAQRQRNALPEGHQRRAARQLDDSNKLDEYIARSTTILL